MYDFNVNVGDTIKSILCNQFKGKLIVTKVEMLEGNQKMIHAKLNGQTDSKTFKFIEGVGSTNGFIVNLSTELESGSILKCYHATNKLIYSQGGDCPAEPKLKPRPTRSK
jgi:hypothetical protein